MAKDQRIQELVMEAVAHLVDRQRLRLDQLPMLKLPPRVARHVEGRFHGLVGIGLDGKLLRQPF
jgi:hypothetical protein